MSDFTFINIDYWIPVLFSTVVLFVVFLIKEWSRKSSSTFVIRIGVALVAILALAVLALKPASRFEIEGKQGVLLTQGYQESQLDSLKKTNPKLEEVIYNDHILQSQLDSLRKVFILGTGVQPYDFWQLADKNVAFLSGAFPAGINNVNYKTSAVEGDAWNVKAQYAKPKIGNQIVLEAPGNLAIDSVRFNRSQDTVFSLQARLKAPGNFVYELVEKDSTGIEIQREPLPLHVLPKQQLNILMLNAFPTFEIKYLKNFLAALNHKVLVRNRLTQGKFKYEYFNRERETLQSLNTTVLETIDLVILDGGAWNSLSRKEQYAVRTAVAQQGMGVFLMPDENLFYGNQPLLNFKFTRTSLSEINLENGVRVSIFGYLFNPSSDINATLKSGNSLLAAQRFLGFGSVSTTVLTNTYALQLKGNKAAYKAVWSELLKPVLRAEDEVVYWEDSHQSVYKNEPYDIQFRTTLNDFKVQDASGASLPVSGDPDIEDLWSVTFYPEQSGWHQLQLKTDSIVSTHSYYVLDSLDWQAKSSRARILANENYFKSSASEETPLYLKQAINPLYFLMIFLLAMGYLWLEPKQAKD
ncbi:hypothetical protein DSM03_103123 [Leeuwenhoekiella aestuarii]|uniref:Uncharacterized protein n=1 Tax=Leeuwenhoekiella aestuarii TaxID=2249426 RepID=A0A4Q0NZ69_9FLAO|nr:hypothetical protein [Leeuwenhoekiella aestuarii]RXG15938.1 hypothetical protein DSM03_103123 [Leeuwenhoekiella aestuarii]RXG16632.1 hypothetical protein DSM04_102213 [Leeuwenhoekiella aestuarii]